MNDRNKKKEKPWGEEAGDLEEDWEDHSDFDDDEDNDDWDEDEDEDWEDDNDEDWED